MRRSDANRQGRHKGARSALLVPAAVALAMMLWVPSPTLAEPERAATAGDPVGAVSRVLVLETERKRTAEELAALSGRIQLSEESVKSLDAEIAAIARDRVRIREAMIAAASAQKAIEADIAATEARIDALAGDEAGLKSSLRERRGLLAEVLGALERMGRKPPPALLVKPDDALGSVRSAILLGAVVPRIRDETEKLVGDLQQLAAVKREIATEKDRFVAGMTKQREEEARLARLFSEKERLEASSRDRRKAEADRAAELAAKATSLEDLIASLDSEAESARAAEAAARKVAEAEAKAEAKRLAAAKAEEARVAAAKAEAERIAAAKAEERRIAALKSEEERLAAQRIEDQRLAALRREEAVRRAELASKSPDERDGGAPSLPPSETETTYDVASLRRDMARIEPAAAFSTMKGRLSVPASGAVRSRFGESDGIGRPASGTTFSARAGDLVTAPSDGTVLYSGPFRSYGQLLILDAGDGYHVVLAGMSEIDVDVGQFVLSGEPVAVMGAKRLASAAGADFGASEPSLYVEFRKDGKPVDPSPWWTERLSGRTRNDS